jgi:copper(I)-binding protein
MTQGDEISVTLMFENAGAVSITVPVDLKRAPKKHKMKH